MLVSDEAAAAIAGAIDLGLAAVRDVLLYRFETATVF